MVKGATLPGPLVELLAEAERSCAAVYRELEPLIPGAPNEPELIITVCRISAVQSAIRRLLVDQKVRA